MKFRVEWLAAAAVLLPFGVAVADYATGGEPAAEAPRAMQELLQIANKVTRSIAAAREQLSAAAAAAKKKEDVLLQTCLLDKLQTVQKLQAKVRAPLAELAHASDPANAQRPFVVVTVIGQKVALTLQEAAGCVDSKNQGAEISLENIKPPSRPETDDEFGTDDELGAGFPPVDDFDLLPPPAGRPETETDLDPSTDDPQVASPAK
ncbi:MAG TPA: hypothetical protein VK509_05520 [Polyangiales bacterium]|nr:hypothetical protein [Polyangiales bacterium]